MKTWFNELIDGWDRFWFTPRHIDTLAVLRILTGTMLLYSHLVLASDFASFVGPDAMIDNATAAALHDGTLGPASAAWSPLWQIDSMPLLWLILFIGIAVTACMTVGFLTRITAPLAFIFQLMLIHRMIGALFGLDQIVTYAAFSVAIAPSGAVLSVDSMIRGKLGQRWWLPADVPSVSANVATRILQIHLCVIYLFGGLAKARGQMWWDGTALWFAVANYEYQSWDVTFLANYPRFFTLLTHITLFWEIFYCALVWPKLTRPLVIAMAVAVHAGIAVFLGMKTFGLMMIFANGIFIAPEVTRVWTSYISKKNDDNTSRTSMLGDGLKPR